MERLQKVIARSGYASRRKAETLILENKVKVNGVLCNTLGTKVSRKDVVTVNGRTIEQEEKVYYVLYKPEGYISTTQDEKDRRKVTDLVPNDKRIFPVGRLDYDTSGVLLMTNDGDFMNLMTSPKHHVEKEYRVKLQGFLRKEESLQLARGVEIDGYKTKRCIVKNVEYNKKNETSIATIIIKEGKYHQVKKMFESVDHPVLKLKRERFGVVTLKGLRTGEARRLKPYEIKQLKESAKDK
ncbi:Ribosomal large subunit pseudouridine synthase B [Candidatus Izimaplasma bacterium HR1]|jgi:23S rRNA pseudouridine2605 synthase|uniref:pseudouridine synthase n=1 Tax=Candidatus Izimoplasma sp. HR1 TaxID=1541959 RepID=UPI0004F7F14D|nr:Ribosomal large subunit pseudouridine synthase B [Candidatus Izimaplasma bacterium HR1]